MFVHPQHPMACPILVVEDDPELREMMATLLTVEGYDPKTAANGREALDHLRGGFTPHVILLDLMMPVMNGWQFRAEQQHDPQFASIPVVIVTALAAQSTAITSVLTGQSMIRSDLRATKPAAMPVIKGLLNGDVIFTNLEAAVALPGETIQEGRGFLTPPEALDALTRMGFNLLALAGNHAFDLKETGIRNTLRELERRHLVHAGTGDTIAEAAAPGYLQTPKGTVG